ncbi:MAG: MFS transporter, partial [Halobacteriovoraceae bacterium]|nr:MFS transporter [Halobacteriovoraceae bacterium]
GAHTLLNHRTVKYLLLFTVMFSVCSMIFFQYVQITLEEAGIPREHFGYYYAFFTATAAISSQKAHLLDARLGEKKTIFLILFLTIFALFGPLIFALTVATLFPVLVMQIQAGIHIPVMSNYLNRHIEGHHRATLNSIKSFIGGILMAVCSPVVGFIADDHGFQTALFGLGIFLFLFLIGPSLKISERISRTSLNRT